MKLLRSTGTPSPAVVATLATWLLVSALAATLAAAADNDSDDSDDKLPSCFSPGECCDLCGSNSIRCARGPCSTNFMTKKLFSFSLPTDSPNFWDIMFSIYSMVPYLAFVAITVELARKRSWSRVFSWCFIPIVSVLTSSILVKSLGHCAECARPCGSCIKSTGMPSGHTTNAVGFCLWLLLETALGMGKQWSLRKKAVVTFFNLLICTPVPYSRYYLGDHTSLQIGVGSANGFVIGLVYFCVLRFVLAKRLDRASKWLAQGRFQVIILNDFHLKPLNSSSPGATSNSAETLESGLAKDGEEVQVYAQIPLTPPVGQRS